MGKIVTRDDILNRLEDDGRGFILVGEYKKSSEKIKLRCKNHHEWMAFISNITRGRGCKKCSTDIKSIRETLTNKEIIIQFKKKHGDEYDYSKTEYVGDNIKVIVICRVHGEFLILPRGHKRGNRCKKCGTEEASLKRTSTTEQCIQKFIKVHSDRYDYSLVNYISCHEEVKIICRTHGVFYQKPTKHTSGKGCSKCSKTGFSQLDEAILYYIKIEPFKGVYFYKIGITNKTVEERFSGRDMNIITIIMTKKYNTGFECQKEETRILRDNSEHRYKGIDILNRDGNTEIFTKDVLELDNE